MPWPTPQDYNEAVQNPRFAFIDADLRGGQPELTPLGLPRPISGNFAYVYKIQNGGQRWAARCFAKEVSDHQRRYAAISAYLAKIRLQYTVPFTYMPAGIKVQGKVYPILRMQWVQGELLHAFVGRTIGYPDTLISLAKVWSRMMADLKAVQIAHGDLQHGNVLVVGDQLRLIDYDGMFVPALAGEHSNECGHRNYQLPTRTGWDYGPYLDNFSAWVIYVSIVALAVHPELWATHRGGDDCLIFREDDFVHPEGSPVLSDLRASPNAQLRFLLEMFTGFFGLSPQDVPSLDGSLPMVTFEPQTRSTAPQSDSNWWTDHLGTSPHGEEERPVEGKPSVEAESLNGDPSWIIESLMDEKPIGAVVFQGQTAELRIVLLGSLALVILTRLLVYMTNLELFIVCSWVLGLNLLVCFIRYKQDPVLAEVETFRRATEVFLRQIREHQTLLDSTSAERVHVQEGLAKGERESSDEKNRLVACLQAELNDMLTRFNSKIGLLSQRRKDTASSEKKKLDSIQQNLGNSVLDIQRKIASLKQAENEEEAAALTVLQDSHIQAYLRNHSINQVWIPGIGVAYTSRLNSAGFFTAADINSRVRFVHGIGPARQNTLLQWRQSLEKEARRSAPGLSLVQRNSIENKYRQERQALELERRRLQLELDSQIGGVRQYFADTRRALNEEEQELRAADAQERLRIHREHDAEVAKLQRRTAAARSQAEPIMNELSSKLRSAQKQVFALRWQSAKREKEGRRFASLRFRDYLRKVISN
jgi:hypothetical protein